jgi:hypothetical protein
VLLALAGLACAVGGFGLAYSPLRLLRLHPDTPVGREVLLIRLLGLVLMMIGAYVIVTSLLTGAPMLPQRRPVPTPTLTTRVL